MTKLIFLLFITSFLSISCNKDKAFQKNCGTDNPLEDIEWLSDLKTSFENNQRSDRITQYTYNSRRVFLDEGCLYCPDVLYYLYDCEQMILCQFGGFGGINTCPDFLDEAIDKKVLYED